MKYISTRNDVSFQVEVPDMYVSGRGGARAVLHLGRCYCAGGIARAAGFPKTDCPFTASTSAARWEAWHDGYANAKVVERGVVMAPPFTLSPGMRMCAGDAFLEASVGNIVVHEVTAPDGTTPECVINRMKARPGIDRIDTSPGGITIKFTEF